MTRIFGMRVEMLENPLREQPAAPCLGCGGLGLLANNIGA